MYFCFLFYQLESCKACCAYYACKYVEPTQSNDCVFFLIKAFVFSVVYNGLCLFFLISLCLHCTPIFFQLFKHNIKLIKLFFCSRPFSLPVLCPSSPYSSLGGCFLVFCTAVFPYSLPSLLFLVMGTFS